MNIIMEHDNLTSMNSISIGIVEDDSELGLFSDALSMSSYFQTIVF